MPIPIMIKFLGLIVAGMLIMSPVSANNTQPVNEQNNIESAQIIADRSGEMVTVWMDPSGHVNIQRASDKPIEPYVILHSNWVPRK